jgi:hypothetical protein
MQNQQGDIRQQELNRALFSVARYGARMRVTALGDAGHLENIRDEVRSVTLGAYCEGSALARSFHATRMNS